jgi:hypothetical protein
MVLSGIMIFALGYLITAYYRAKDSDEIYTAQHDVQRILKELEASSKSSK